MIYQFCVQVRCVSIAYLDFLYRLSAVDTGFHKLPDNFDLTDDEINLSQLSVCLDHWTTTKGRKKKKKTAKMEIDNMESKLDMEYVYLNIYLILLCSQ